MAVALASRHASGSCSAQPGRGVASASGAVAAPATSPAGRTSTAFTALVPTSNPRNSASSISADTQQQLHRELVETLVGVAAGTQRHQVERLGLERARALRAELYARDDVAAAATVAQLPQQLLDLDVVVEALDSLFQDQIRAHTPRGEGPHPIFILGAVGMTVEMPHPGPARILEQLDEEKRRLGIVAAEPQILVEPPRLLPIEIDVEELAGFQRLGHGVGEVEARHALVCHLRIHAHHLGMLQRIDESEHVSGGREEHVAARLVRLRLEREPEVVALRPHVLAQEIDGVAVPAERGAG